NPHRMQPGRGEGDFGIPGQTRRVPQDRGFIESARSKPVDFHCLDRIRDGRGADDQRGFRILCWTGRDPERRGRPDCMLAGGGCMMSQESGLELVSAMRSGHDSKKIAAFLPKLFAAFNGVYKEMAGTESDEIIVPVSGASFHILRKNQMYMVLVGERRQLPKR